MPVTPTPEYIEALSRYLAKVGPELANAVQRIMEENPPPDGDVVMGASAFVQALTELAFVAGTAAHIGPKTIHKMVQLMAEYKAHAPLPIGFHVIEAEDAVGSVAMPGRPFSSN